MFMCAIAGILGSTGENREILEGMLKTMTRRGPDQWGIFQKKGLSLLHARLAVVDLAGGRQPMDLLFRGIHYHMVYNGELYNTEELRRLLVLDGHTFLGHSDTEVVLHAYAQWGGQLCGAVQRYFCIRRLGGGAGAPVPGPGPDWGEASVLHHPGRTISIRLGAEKRSWPIRRSPPRWTPRAWQRSCFLGPGRTPGCGVFRGIREVEPGCCGYFDGQDMRLHRYWRLEDREHQDTLPQTLERVRALVSDAIRRQLVSDVPICTFLSGGLDSSLISSVAAREEARQGRKLHTFSVDYKDNAKYFHAGKFQPNSDPEFIQIMTQYLDSQHHWVILDTQELADALDEAVEARDLPGMADVDASLLLLCRKMKETATVALSGNAPMRFSAATPGTGTRRCGSGQASPGPNPPPGGVPS